MALWGRRINNFLELWYLVASRVLGIWVSSTSFQKSNIGCPQQPLTEKVLNFNMIFHDSTQKSFFQNAPRHHNLQKCWSFYPSEPFRIIHFNMRHPVAVYDRSRIFDIRPKLKFSFWKIRPSAEGLSWSRRYEVL